MFFFYKNYLFILFETLNIFAAWTHLPKKKETFWKVICHFKKSVDICVFYLPQKCLLSATLIELS